MHAIIAYIKKKKSIELHIAKGEMVLINVLKKEIKSSERERHASYP